MSEARRLVRSIGRVRERVDAHALIPRDSMYASTFSARVPSPARSKVCTSAQHVSCVGACPAARESMKTPSAEPGMRSRSHSASMSSNTASGTGASSSAKASTYDARASL